jgi:hypothetical protein
LTREEPGYKKTIGTNNHNHNKGIVKDDVVCFVNCAAQRLNRVFEYRSTKATKEFDLERGKLKKQTVEELMEEDRIHPSVEFTNQTELKFFKLIKCISDKEDSVKKQLI